NWIRLGSSGAGVGTGAPGAWAGAPVVVGTPGSGCAGGLGGGWDPSREGTSPASSTARRTGGGGKGGMGRSALQAAGEQRRGPPAADADGGEPQAGAALAQGVEEGDHDARPGGADRVAERHRAAAHVDAVGRKCQIAQEGLGDDGEGL